MLAEEVEHVMGIFSSGVSADSFRPNSNQQASLVAQEKRRGRRTMTATVVQHCSVHYPCSRQHIEPILECPSHHRMSAHFYSVPETGTAGTIPENQPCGRRPAPARISKGATALTVGISSTHGSSRHIRSRTSHTTCHMLQADGQVLS